MVKYKPYNVDKGKEKSVVDKNGRIYAGQYVENIIKKDTENINIGFYDDPVRGNNEIASMPIKSLKRHTFITGSTGYGKSLLLKSFIYQVDFKTDKNYLIFDGKGDLSQDISNKNNVTYINPHKTDYSLNLAEKDFYVFIFIYNDILNLDERKNKDKQFMETLDDLVSPDNYKEVIYETDDYLDINEREEKLLEEFRKIDKEIYQFLFDNNKELGNQLCKNNFAFGFQKTNVLEDKIVNNILLQYIIKKKQENNDSDNIIFLDSILEYTNKNILDKYLSLGRSLGLNIVLSNQNLGEISLGNYQNLITFSLSDSVKASRMAQIYNSYNSEYTISEEEIRNLEKFECIMRPITKDGYKSDIPFNVKVFPPLKPE